MSLACGREGKGAGIRWAVEDDVRILGILDGDVSWPARLPAGWARSARVQASVRRSKI
jgi:hypothetical protein